MGVAVFVARSSPSNLYVPTPLWFPLPHKVKRAFKKKELGGIIIKIEIHNHFNLYAPAFTINKMTNKQTENFIFILRKIGITFAEMRSFHLAHQY